MRRSAFTLLEVLLTLALTVVLMSLIGAAISFYGNQLQVRDTEVRRVQLARAIVKMISDDLRASLSPPEFDPAPLAQLLGSASGAQGMASALGLSDQAGALGSLDVGDEMAVDQMDLAFGTVGTRRPGLIGNQFQIQFDVSRLPRVEEYQLMLQPIAPGEVVDPPSDIKTISYFVQQPGMGGVVDDLMQVGAQDADEAAAAGGGLVRRELDRAVNQFAMVTGGEARLQSTGDLVAPEVVGIEFQYWDGMMWLPTWHSDELGTLPPAIQVRLTLSESRVGSADPSHEVPVRVYEQIIRLPMGRPSAEVMAEHELSAGGF